MKSSELLKEHNVSIQNFYKYSKSGSDKLINIFPNLDSISIDLMELIMSLYIIDKKYSHNEKLTFEAINIDIWSDKVIKLLQNIYQFLTLDKIVKINVVKKRISSTYIQNRLLYVDKIEYPKESKLCLFSGGMDSTCAILKLIREGQIVIPIHTLTNNRNLNLIRKLHKLDIIKNQNIFYADLRDIKIGEIENDVGNTRGLIYLTNAFIFSKMFNVNTLIFPENGPMMINPKTSIWLSPTRNAHPYFINMYRDFINIIERNFKIDCIFKDMTKSELIFNEKNKNILNNTYSCFSIRQKNHCGLCYACLVRKYSSLATNYVENNNIYENNILTTSLESVELKNFLDAIIMFLKTFKNDYDFSSNPNINYIPDNFFNDYKLLLKKFSIDMLLGIYRDCSLNLSSLNKVGEFAYNEIRKLDKTLFVDRKRELGII